MSTYFDRQLKRSISDTVSDGFTGSTPTQASPRTKRRKTQRRIGIASAATSERELLLGAFEHLRVLGRVNAYAQLTNNLVIAPSDPLVDEFSSLDPPPIPGFDRSLVTFIKACTPVEMAHLKHFDRPDHQPDPQYTPIISDAATLVADLLELPELLFFPERHDLAGVRYYPNKFAGIEYAVMGLKTRRDANNVAQADAESAFDALMAGERVQPHDVRLGGRGKIASMTPEQARGNPPAVGRLILMLSHRDLKLCGVTENQLTRSYSDDRYPIAVGLSWYHGGSARFIQRMSMYKEWFCFDAKKFDSSINPWMVRIAINILRNQYIDGMSVQYDAYWNFVEESLLRAPIYRDDGIRIQKFVGTTSGHSHNTLIQSIITLMLGYAVFMVLHPFMTIEEITEHMWVESLGDDNIIGVKGPLLGHTVEEISEVMLMVFQVDWFGKKSFSTTRLLDPSMGDFEGVQFLGKYFYLGEYPQNGQTIPVPLPYRPAKETYLRLLYPEYGDLTGEMTYLRVLGNYIDAAGNRLMEAWLQRFMDWLDERVDAIPSEWPSNFKRMVSRDYSNTGVEVPRPLRLNFEQWKDLVVLKRGDYKEQWPELDSQFM